MSNSQDNGKKGEAAAEALLIYEGWEIIDRQVPVHGHKVDLLAKHPIHGEVLFEVKVWATKTSGVDTVLKAIAVADDLRSCREQRPYILILSRELTGLYRDMLDRALARGALYEYRILGFPVVRRPGEPPEFAQGELL